jgi:hypothetical protein
LFPKLFPKLGSRFLRCEHYDRSELRRVNLPFELFRKVVR